MSDNIIDVNVAVQESYNDVRKSLRGNTDGDIWFSWLPFVNGYLVLEKSDSKYFGKKIIIILFSSWSIAGIGAFASIKNPDGLIVQLLVSVPIFTGYAYLLYEYLVIRRVSQKVKLNYSPFFEVSKILSYKTTKMGLIKFIIVVILFSFLLFIASIFIFLNSNYAIFIIINSLVIISLNPLLLTLSALLLKLKRKN